MTDHATYHEHIVGCTYVPCGEDLVLVLPASTNGRVRGRTVAMCHACFLQCESSGRTTESARANLPCSYALMEYAMDEERRREEW